MKVEYNYNTAYDTDKLYSSVLYDDHVLSEPASGPMAGLILGRELTIDSDDDLLFHGMSSGNYDYILAIHNINDSSDTILEDLNFSINANDIDPDGIWWREYSSIDASLLSWFFPPEFTIEEDDWFNVGYESTTVATDYLSVDLFRLMNVTEFHSDGYQLAQCTVTFKDKNFNGAWGNIGLWDEYEVEPRIISASGPTDVLDHFGFEDNQVFFDFNYNEIQVDTPYTFTVEIFVDLTDNVPPPIKFKPEFRMWLNKDHIEINDGQSYTADMPESMLFDNINAASASTNILNTWIFAKHYHVVGELEYVVEQVGPRAEFNIGKMVTVETDEDSILSGPFSGYDRYFFDIYNIEESSDTVLSDLEFDVNASNIDENNIWWDGYSSLDGSLLSWDFPPEFMLEECDGFGVGYGTSGSEDGFLNMDISRSLNVTDFDTDGYQLARFTVTFKDKNFHWAWGNIDVWEQFEVEPRIISASGPTDVLNYFAFDDGYVHFGFDYDRIQINTPYIFTVIIFVDLTDNIAPPLRFKPRFEVGVNKDRNEIIGGQSYTANIPESLLFDSISAASVTTNVSNIWMFSNNSEVHGILQNVVHPIGPRADFVFEKNFGIHSDSDVLLDDTYSENLWYTLYLENTEDETDTVMGDLEFHASTTDTIQDVGWEEYADWNSSLVDWSFPSPEFALHDHNQLFTGFNTDYAEARNLNMDISRSFNRTVFDSDGYQLATFKVTFKDNNMQWVWGNIEIFDFSDGNINFVPETFVTDAPLEFDQIYDSERIGFGIDPQDIVPNTEYTFSVVIEIDYPSEIEGTGINFTYKPNFNIGLNNAEIRDNGGEGYVTSMPEHMLYDNITSVSASNNISNIWTLISRNQVIVNLAQIDEIDSIKVTDFIVTPTDPISVNNPAYISANVTGINLSDVGFMVIEPESGIIPVIEFMDHVNDDQFEGSWNAKGFALTDGVTTMEPVTTIICPQGMLLPDEDAFVVLGLVQINDSAGICFSAAIFNDSQLVDLWLLQDEGGEESIFDQIEYGETVFTPFLFTVDDEPKTEVLTINQNFNIHECLAPNIPFDIGIMASDDYHGDEFDICSDIVTVTVDNEFYPIIYVNPDYQEQYPGSNFTVDINVDPQGIEVYAGEYEVHFDQTKLEAVEQIQGNFLSQDGADTMVMDNAIDNVNGTVSYAETRLEVQNGVVDPGTLASIEFIVRDPVSSYGETVLDLTNVILADPQPQPQPIPDVVVNDGIVNILENQPPVADAGPDKPSCENVGTGVSFDGSGSYDPDGTIVSYDWDFGDGNTGSVETPSHTYTSANYNGYTVTLTVTDNDGATDADTATVVIWIIGDANGDHVVNILDAALVGIHWGETPENPNFSPCADLNNDDVINILDAALIGIHWGETG